MNNINWEVRFKNPQFIGQIVLSIFLPILAYAGISAQDLTSWMILGELLLDALMSPYVLSMVVVSVYNAIQDPTTAGIGDSAQALTYTTPKEDK